jgi:hypothetical protein
MSRSKPSPAAVRTAAVLEQLLLDPEFRARFRRAPAATLERSGLPDLARGLRGDGRALQTLESRESRSSVAGMLMAAAVEGAGLLQRVRRPDTLDPDAEEALRAAMARPAIRRLTAAVELPPEGAGDPPQGAASVDALWAWAQRSGRAVTVGPPRPGDLIVSNEQVGIVERVDTDGTVHAIEGGTADRIMRRAHSPADVVGYVRLG